jgi:hypothetical protein
MQSTVTYVDILNRIEIRLLLEYYESYSLHLSPGFQKACAKV